MRDSTKRIVTTVSIVVIIIFLIILGSVFFGIKAIGSIFLWVLGGLFIVAIIGIVIYVVYYLFFKKHKFDATYMNKKSLINAGRISKPDNINDLYLSGDAAHSRRRIGKIIGYCRIQIMRKIQHYDPDTGEPLTVRDPKNPDKMIYKFSLEKDEQDVFVIEKSGFPMNLFTEPMVVRVAPSDHDDLIGDVTLFGFSILPISEYWFLHKDYIDVRQIDFTILKEAERGIFFESLKDTKEIIDKAIGLDAGHKKQIEQKNLYEIPALQQGGQNQ